MKKKLKKIRVSNSRKIKKATPTTGKLLIILPEKTNNFIEHPTKNAPARCVFCLSDTLPIVFTIIGFEGLI
jgi:hypothetical protein